MKNIAVFASGGGSNFKVIYNNIQNGQISGKIKILISNNENCGAVDFARRNNILTIIENKFMYSNLLEYYRLLLQKLNENNIDLIVLAGYLKLLSKEIINKYNNSIINIHPSLLPKFGGKGFYGIKVHEAVIKSGEKYSGATVHFVDEEYDKGEIVAQEKVLVYDTDSPQVLAKRVLNMEHILYSKVVKAFCEDRIIWNKGKPKIEVSIED